MENTGLACSECGVELTVARIEARPDTTLCVECKTKLTKRPKPAARENPEKVRKRRRRGPDFSRITQIG